MTYVLVALALLFFSGGVLASYVHTRRELARWYAEREEERRRARARMLDAVEEDLATLSHRTWRSR